MLSVNAFINSEPKAVPSLYRQSFKLFVKNLIRTAKSGARVRQLHDLPAVALRDIFVEMSCYPALSNSLHRELSDPELFMKVFLLNGESRLKLEKCLRSASRIGKSVLPDLTKNWCKVMSEEKTFTVKMSQAVLDLATYLYEAGWAYDSVKVLFVAVRIIPQERTTIRIECVQKLLRSEGSALLWTKATETCNNLLEMVGDITDGTVRLKVYLEVAIHYYKTQRFVESDGWTLKALKLITETTQAEIIIELLQLKALHLFRSRNNEAANMVIRQAIYRARSAFGLHHRLYADTLHTYGISLLKTNRCWNAVQILLEQLKIITSLYGKYTPHVATIESHLAIGFHRLSEVTGRIGSHQNRLQNAIRLAESIMHQRGMDDHFVTVREMIMKGRNDFYDATNRIKAVKDGAIIPIEEIKQLCLRMSENVPVDEPTSE